MRRMICLPLCALLLVLAGPSGHLADAADPPATVDAAVVLAADVSRSIDDGEFALERRGYADAIQNQKLMDAISTGPTWSDRAGLCRMGGRERAEARGRLDRDPRMRPMRTPSPPL